MEATSILTRGARAKAHALTERYKLNLSNATDAADLTDMVRLQFESGVVSDQRRAYLTDRALIGLGVESQPRQEILARMRGHGVLPVPTSRDEITGSYDLATQTYTVTAKRLDHEAALGVKPLDNLAVNTGRFAQDVATAVDSQPWLKYGLVALDVAAGPVAFAVREAVGASPVGQALQDVQTFVQSTVTARFVDVGDIGERAESGGIGAMVAMGAVIGGAADGLLRGVRSAVERLEENVANGRAREWRVQRRLEGAFPNSIVQRESYLRNADGSRAMDPLSGEARRVDHVVIQNGEVLYLVETTSPTANKIEQILKEQAIRSQGPVYIRDRATGKLIDVSEIQTRMIRVK